MRIEITILPATIRSIIIHVSSLLPENARIKIYESIILRYGMWMRNLIFRL